MTNKEHLISAVLFFIACLAFSGMVLWRVFFPDPTAAESFIIKKLFPGLSAQQSTAVTNQPTPTSNQLLADLLSPNSDPLASTSPRPAAKSIPSRYVIAGGRHFFQTFNNCGPASLAMALSYYGIDQSQQQLADDLRPYQIAGGDNDDKSVTLAELAAKAQEYDLLVYHRPAGNIELLQRFIANDLAVITRTLLKPDEDIGHYRVIKGYDKTTGELIQDDSLQGANLTYSNHDFEQLWQAFNFEFLVLVPQEKAEVAKSLLGSLLDEQQAWQLALANSDQAIDRDNSNIYAHFNRSVALYHLGRYQESIDAFETVQLQLPFRMLWYQLEPILAYYQTGDYPSFFTLSEKVLARDNKAYSELYYLAGKIYQAEGKVSQADQAFSQAAIYNHPQGYWLKNIE